MTSPCLKVTDTLQDAVGGDAGRRGDWVRPPGLLESSSNQKEPEAGREQLEPSGFGWSASKRKGRGRTPERWKRSAPSSGVELREPAEGGSGPKKREEVEQDSGYRFLSLSFRAEGVPLGPGRVPGLLRHSVCETGIF